MKPLEYRFSLDMSDETTQVFCNVRRGDDCSKIIVSLRENGRAYKFDDDVHVYFLAKKSDEIVVYTECSINNNTIVYNFTAQTAPASGTVICQFLLLSSSNRLETPTFRLEVFDNINIDPDSPESLPEYTALIDATQDAINATDEMRELMEEIDRDFSSKMDLAPIDPLARDIVQLPIGQLWVDTVNQKLSLKADRELFSVYGTEYIDSSKMGFVPLDPSSEQIAAMLSGQLYGDTVNHKGKVKGGQSFYDTEYIDTALALKAPLSDFNTLSARAVQPSNVTIDHTNWQNYNNANNLTPNRTYGISARVIGPVPQEGEDPDPTYGYVDNLPVYNKTAALTFIGVSKTGKSGYQIYYNDNECWFRKTDSSGSGTWIRIVKAPPTTRGLRTYEVVCFGDSLTAGSGCMIPYHYYESLFGNHICHNYGIGGTGYIKEKGSASEPKYDYRGTGQIGKPDSTVELLGGNNVLDYFRENESSITSSTAIVIFAGTNDYGAQYGLDAFETAIRNMYTYVLEHHTQPLIVCTPMNRVARDNETITLEQYVNKIIAVCTEMKIPVIDFYHNVQLRPDITAWKTVYFADKIHPNDMGHQLIGAFFGAKLNEYLGC